MQRFYVMLLLLCTACVVGLNAETLFAKSKKISHQKKSSAAHDVLLQALLDLNSSALTKIESTKTVESSLIGKKTDYAGNIFLSQGKFRWDTIAPEKSSIIFDGKIVWVVDGQYITKTVVTKNLKSQTLQNILLNPKSLNKKFTVKQTEAAGMFNFSLIPLGKDIDAKDIVLKLDAATKEIKQLSFSESDTKTLIVFHKIEKLPKADSKLFTYKIKPGDQVTEM